LTFYTLARLACAPLLISGLMLTVHGKVAPPTDVCALVTAAEFSTLLGKPVGQGMATRGEVPPGSPIVRRNCIYMTKGITILVANEQYPSSGGAKQEFDERLANSKSHDGGSQKTTSEPGVADGAFWTTGPASYAALRADRIVTIGLVGPDTTAIAAVPHDRLKALVLAAFSR
jgi:hypothetical protein